MAIVDDYKDIASRMKGELKVKAEAKVEEIDAFSYEPEECLACNGSGQDPRKYWASLCPHCNGKGTV